MIIIHDVHIQNFVDMVICCCDRFEVMLGCWSVSPIDRPSFSMLKDKLDTILSVKPDQDFPQANASDLIYINVPGAATSL